MDIRDRRIRGLLWKSIVLFVLLILLVILIDPVFRRRELRRSGGTTFGTSPSGFRGILEVANRLGLTAERFRRAYVSLPSPRSSVLVVLDPKPWTRLLDGPNLSVEQTSIRLVREWVEEGGVLIYAPPSRSIGGALGRDFIVPTAPGEVTPPDGIYDQELLQEKKGIADPFRPLFEDAPLRQWVDAEGPMEGEGLLEGEEWDLQPLDPRLRKSLAAYLGPRRDPAEPPSIAAFETASDSDAAEISSGDEDPFEPLLLLGGSPIALARDIGEGRVIVCSTSYPWTNGAIGTADAGPAVVRLLDWASEGGTRTFWFDEYAHGLGIRKGALRWIWDTDLFYVIATCMIGIGLLSWGGAIRLGPPLEERFLPGRAKEEFVVSLADIYLRARRPHLAAELILRGHQDEIAALLGMDAAPLSSRTGIEEFRTLRTELATRAPGDSSSLLRFARRVHAASARARDRIQSRTGGLR